MEAPGHVPSVPSPKSGTDYIAVCVFIACLFCKRFVALL